MIFSLIEMLQYDFIVRALIAGIAISICAALIGNCIVPRKQSMVGDGLSHVAFGAAALATVLNLAPLEFSIPIVIIASFFILKINKDSHFNSDSVIAIFSASALAIGTILISIKNSSNIDLNSYLFGSILAISRMDLIFSVILAIVLIFIFIIFYRHIFAITYDEKFAKSIGINVQIYNTGIAILCSLVIIIGMKLLGALLISSLLIFPQLIVAPHMRSFKQNLVVSVTVSVIVFIVGLTFSYILNTPTGATIVIANLITLILSLIYNKLR